MFQVEEETAAMIDRAVRAIDRVIEEHIDPLLDRAGAEELKAEMRLPRKGLAAGQVRGTAALELVKCLLRRHRFYGGCPACEGRGCRECKGRGWITVSMAGRRAKLAAQQK